MNQYCIHFARLFSPYR